jgi:hypothetical protein
VVLEHPRLLLLGLQLSHDLLHLLLEGRRVWRDVRLQLLHLVLCRLEGQLQLVVLCHLGLVLGDKGWDLTLVVLLLIGQLGVQSCDLLF